jgi:aldose 1-epimerase
MGKVIELACGGATARLLPHAGGRTSRLCLVDPVHGFTEVLHPYPDGPQDRFDPVHWAKGGIYPLIPYSNRIENATLRVGDAAFSLTPHPDALPHTLHGHAHTQAWQAQLIDASSATLRLDSPASKDWPWHYHASQHIALTESSLTVSLTLTHLGTGAMPAGIGLHPYFRHTAEAKIAFGARQQWSVAPDFLPLGNQAARVHNPYADGPHVLPAGTMTDYWADWDGKASLQLPGEANLQLTSSPTIRQLVVHRPVSPIYLCLEPVSHVANAFNMAARGVADTGAVWLKAGETLSGQVCFRLADQA